MVYNRIFISRFSDLLKVCNSLIYFHKIKFKFVNISYSISSKDRVCFVQKHKTKVNWKFTLKSWNTSSILPIKSTGNLQHLIKLAYVGNSFMWGYILYYWYHIMNLIQVGLTSSWVYIRLHARHCFPGIDSDKDWMLYL